MSSEVNKIYNLYEIFRDFNRLRILVAIYEKECTIKELSDSVNLNIISITHQLEFLIGKKVVTKLEVDDITKYKLSDKRFNKIINQIINYIK